MGKFMELVKEEQETYTKTEAAVHNAGFARAVQPGCWERWMYTGSGAVHAELDVRMGALYVKRDGRDAPVRAYRLPDGVWEKDSADTLLSWLDKKLEPWLPGAEAPEDAAKPYRKRAEAALRRAGFVQCQNPRYWEREEKTENGGTLCASFNLCTHILYIKTQGISKESIMVPESVREKENGKETVKWINKKLEYCAKRMP